jgi:acyl transferase domain-containing protein/aryl carrier-like protein
MTASEERLRHYLRKVTNDLQESRRRLAEAEGRTREPIAIIAMGCRYPGGVRNPEDMWELVSTGVDAIGPYPGNRGWESMKEVVSTKSSDLPPGYAQAGGFLADIAGFDSQFFGISPREALLMDPQQRMALEVTWEVIERAGIAATDLRGSATGVFFGSTGADYMASIMQTDNDLLASPDAAVRPDPSDDDFAHIHGNDADAARYIPDDSDATHMMTGSMASVLSGRLAYAFGTSGPAVTVDTACSSSLVAIHQACQSLYSGESDLAIAGGIMVMSTPMLLGMSRLASAPDGRCKAFGEGADGTGWGEGTGIVLLERLSDAVRNNHPVAAVIRGSAINQDGASNGMAAPNGLAQQQLIRSALADARMSAADVDVVEAHGTGTNLGDPIEAGALLATYGVDRDPARPLWLGSVKSNIGHAGPAAGIAGLIKLVMAIRNGLLPQTLHAAVPTSKVDWASGGVRVLSQSVDWTSDTRVGAVSSFGVSGTNAHVIISSAPDAPASGATSGALTAVPWVVSARTANALRAQALRLQDWLSASKPGALDIGLTLASRVAFKHRAVVIGHDAADLSKALEALVASQPDPALSQAVAGNPGRPVFIYPGHGGQWAGMGRELLETSKVFARSVAECDAALHPWTGWSVTAVLRQDPGAPGLDTVDVAQPALFAMMVALTELWKAYGVVPAAVVGHSQGEVTAAYVAGALSLADAARIVAIRSSLLATLTNGTMMAVVGLTASELEQRVQRFGDRAAVAVVNSPEAVTLSGRPEALAELFDELTETGARVRYVRGATGAGHSADVDRFRDEVLEKFADVTPTVARIPFYSAAIGDELDATALDAEYWFRNMRNTVRFDSAMRSAFRAGFRTFVEPGPHPVLLPAVEQIAADLSVDVLTSGTLQHEQGDLGRFFGSAAELYVAGLAVDWRAAFADGDARHRPDLPTYPFQHQRYWLPDELGGAPQRQAPARDGEFWRLVERGDAQQLATLLGGGDTDALAAVLPQLSAWWQRSARDGAVESYCYRQTFVQIARRPVSAGRGTWYVVVPTGRDDDRAGAIATAIRDQLGDVLPIAVPADATTPDVVAILRDAMTAERPAGVVSLLEGTAATLRLLQALAEHRFDHPLWCTTASAVPAGRGDTAVDPDQAGLWGLGRVAAVEFPDLWGGVIDLPESLEPAALSSLGSVLSHGGDDQVALRADGVFVRRVQRLGCERDGAWRVRGTALVIGADEATGRNLADRLAESGADRVVLADAGTVGDRDAVARLLDDAEDLTTVISVAGAGTEFALRDADAESLVRPATAATVLDDALSERALDAYVLLYPATATWGLARESAAAAAGAHATALAQRRRSRGLAATAIGWDPTSRQGTGTKPMESAAMLDALARVVGCAPDADAVIAAIDWDQPESVLALTRAGSPFVDLPDFRRMRAHHEHAEEDHSSLLSDLAAMTPEEQERTLAELIRSEIAAVLRYDSVDDVEPATPFRDLGLDSISGMRIRKRLAAATGLDLSVRMVIEHPTTEELAQYLGSRLAEQPDPMGTMPPDRLEV